MNKLLVLSIIITFTILISPQSDQRINSEMNGIIKGKIIDEQTGSPIEYGNFVLYRSRDSVLFSGTVSNTDGEFIIEKVPPGRYYAKVKFLGYKGKYVDSIFITPKRSELSLGEIKIVPSRLNLNEVVIQSERDYIENRIDKKVINVEKSLVSQGGTALDVMQNVPSISVDVDGNVSLRGNSNVNILIDGKPSGLSSISSSDVLTQIPASSIQSIEVVTNPSAKYDPEGTSGIINIILKKKGNNGFNGMLSLNAGWGDKYNSSLNFNYRGSGFNLFSAYDARFNNSNNSGNTNRTSGFNSLNYLSQINNGASRGIHHNVNTGIDILPDEFNVITLGVKYREMGREGSGLGLNNLTDENNNLIYSFLNKTDNNRKVRSFDYSLTYKRTFETKGKELVLDFSFEDNKMNRGDNTFQQNSYLNSVINNDFSLRRSFNNAKNKEYALQGDYTNPFNENSNLQLGFKSSLKNFDIDANYENLNQETHQWIPNLNLLNNYTYDEQIHAVYSIYNGQLGIFNYQAGLRAEQVITKSKLELSTVANENNYFSLYPTVHFMYASGEANEFKLSYSRRVDRPGHRRILPFVDYSDTLNITSGNADLKPQYIDSYELSHSGFYDKTSVTSTLFYRKTNGLIADVSKLLENGVTFTRPENIAQSLSYGVELTLGQPLFQWWRMNANFTYYKNETNSGSSSGDINNNSYSWMGKLNSNITLFSGLQLQLMLNYSAPTVMTQEKIKETYFVDIAAKKDFFDGKVSLNLRVSDIFNTRKHQSERTGFGFVSVGNYKQDSRIVYLGISYNFNNFKQEQKKRPQDEGSDDF